LAISIEDQEKEQKMQLEISAVLRVIDRFRKKPVTAAQIAVFLDGQRVKPIAKPDGYFVLINLPSGPFSVEILSQIFEPFRFDLTVPGPGSPYPIILVMLGPAPCYPNLRQATVLTGALQRAGKPLGCTTVYFVKNDAEKSPKIAQDKVEQGATALKLYLSSPSAQILFGGNYLILDKEANKQEFCMLTGAQGNENGVYTLCSGLHITHARGAPLLEAVACTTDASGRFYCALEEGFEKSPLSICLAGPVGEKLKMQPLTVLPGKENQLGLITL
jgi:hypothetical protein